jgi:hypothetical protein
MDICGKYVASGPGTVTVPRLTVLMIRTALAYLATGFLFGSLLLIPDGMMLSGTAWQRLLQLHIEYLLLGWFAQLALGVAFWILPRFRSGADRGREGPAWVALALLNPGTPVVAIGSAAGAPSTMLLLGRCTEGLAVGAFVLHAWPRVKTFGAKA